MASACLLRVHVQLLRLSGRLATRSSDNEYILEAVLIKSLASSLDGYFAFLVRYVLSFAIGALNENSGDMALYR